MFFSPAETAGWLMEYRYLILFPISVIEGPIVTIIAGFFVSLKIFNVFAVYIIVAAGDALGDSIIYAIGRSGGEKFLRRFGLHFGLTEKKIQDVKAYFDLHKHKAIALSKLIHGLGMAGLFAAGSLKIPYPRYIGICFLVTIVQSSVYMTIGIFFGQAYIKLSQYLDYFSAATIIIGLALLLIFVLRKFKILSKD